MFLQSYIESVLAYLSYIVEFEIEMLHLALSVYYIYSTTPLSPPPKKKQKTFSFAFQVREEGIAS